MQVPLPQQEQQPASSDTVTSSQTFVETLEPAARCTGSGTSRSTMLALGVLSLAGHSVACHFFGSHASVSKMGR
jgi:hypothetical protein